MADFDGNIKLGISLDIDSKSLNSELSALTKQIKTAFSTVNKNSAEMSSSFSTVNKDVEKVTNTVKDLGSQVNGLSSRTKIIKSIGSNQFISTSKTPKIKNARFLEQISFTLIPLLCIKMLVIRCLET